MKNKKLGTLDWVLLFCALFVLIFTITMIVIFCTYQTVPDTLINAVFGLVGGEMVVCWRIWAKKKGIDIKESEDNDYGMDN